MHHHQHHHDTSNISSIALGVDDSTLTKSLSIDEKDESVVVAITGFNDKLKALLKEKNALNQALSQKDREIQYWKCKIDDEADLQEIIRNLERKLEKSELEVKHLKNSQTALEAEYQTKYIEKSLYNKELIELNGRINYLTSENERLNTLILQKFESARNKDGIRLDMSLLEEKNSQLTLSLDELSEKNKRLELKVTESNREIQEWKNKYNDLEGMNQEIKSRLVNSEKEQESLKKINQEKDLQISNLLDVERQLIDLKKENHKLEGLLEKREKESKEMKIKLLDLEDKDADLNYLKERVEVTVKENKELHMNVLQKTFEIDQWKTKFEEIRKKWEMIKEYESSVEKLTTEKEELTAKFTKKAASLDKLKASYTTLYGEYNELQAKTEYLAQENDELKRATLAYAEMIQDLKNSVVKQDTELFKTLDFGSKE